MRSLTLDMLKTMMESLHYEVNVVRDSDGSTCLQTRVGQEAVFPFDESDAFTLCVSVGADNYLSLYTMIDQRRLDQPSQDWVAAQALSLNRWNQCTRIGADPTTDSLLVISADVFLEGLSPTPAFLNREIKEVMRCVSDVAEIVMRAEREMHDDA